LGSNIASRADIINFRSVADDPEQLLQDLHIDDDPIWAEEDPVHCIAKVYSAMAGSLIGLLKSRYCRMRRMESPQPSDSAWNAS
jgi:hypothetical protein